MSQSKSHFKTVVVASATVKIASEAIVSEAAFVFILLVLPERGFVSNCDKAGVGAVLHSMRNIRIPL